MMGRSRALNPCTGPPLRQGRRSAVSLTERLSVDARLPRTDSIDAPDQGSPALSFDNVRPFANEGSTREEGLFQPAPAASEARRSRTS